MSQSHARPSLAAAFAALWPRSARRVAAPRPPSPPGSVRGTVTGPDGKPMAAVPVRLFATTSPDSRPRRTTDSDGRFQFFNVPFNPYELHVEAQGFKSRHIKPSTSGRRRHRRSTSRSQLAAVTESVKVEARTDRPPCSRRTPRMSHIDIDKSYIAARAGGRPVPRRWRTIVTSDARLLAKDENGRYHFQGAHSQNELRRRRADDLRPDRRHVLELDRPGHRSSRSRSSTATCRPSTARRSARHQPDDEVRRSDRAGFKGDVHGGSRASTPTKPGPPSAAAADASGSSAPSTASESDHFTGPGQPRQPQQPRRDAAGVPAPRLRDPELSTSFRLSALLGRTDRDVPNTYTQEAAGAGQARPDRTTGTSTSAGRPSSASTTALDATAFGRNASSRCTPARRTTRPVITDSNRSLDNYGMHSVADRASPATQRVQGRRRLQELPDRGALLLRHHRPGLQRSGLRRLQPEPRALRPDARRQPLRLSTSRRPAPTVAGVLEDNIRLEATSRLNVGLRYDHNDFP